MRCRWPADYEVRQAAAASSCATIGAGERAAVAREHDGRLERGELADRPLGPRCVESVGVERHSWRLGPAVHVSHVEAVGHQRDAVACAPQPDEPWGVAGQVNDLEPGDGIALVDRAVDVDGSAVPHEAVAETVQQSDVELQIIHPPVVAAAGALGLRDRVGVAEHVGVGAQRRRGAAVVGVAVAKNDPGDAAEPAGGGDDRSSHALLASVVDGDSRAARLLNEIDVHRPKKAPAQQPHAVGNTFWRGARKPAQARARANGGGPCGGRGAGKGHGESSAELPAA